MRRAAKVDENQAGIVKALRAHGWSVLSLAAMGKGCPDLLVGAKGVNLLLEVKDGSKAPSKRRLTEDETRFFGAWNGHRALVETAEQAVAEVKRHLAEVSARKPEVQGPTWTAEEWHQAAKALAASLVLHDNPLSRERIESLRWDALAMARALGGGK